jgi:hypothetical protein
MQNREGKLSDSIGKMRQDKDKEKWNDISEFFL